MKMIGLRSIRRDALECVGHLGSGQFGSVEEALWHWSKTEVKVALKSLNGKLLGELDTIKFLQEAVLMAQFKHPNIVSLYGAVIIGKPVCVCVRVLSVHVCVCARVLSVCVCVCVCACVCVECVC